MRRTMIITLAVSLLQVGRADTAVAGPEPNDYSCPYAPNGGPAHVVCYTFWGHHLRVGNAKWGFRHIRARRGFSHKTARYLLDTIRHGRKVHEGGGSYRITRRYTRKCEIRVVFSDRKDSVITMYRVDPNKKGYFDVCP
jgi:hypothetical protein